MYDNTQTFQLVLSPRVTAKIAASSGQFCYLTKTGLVYCLAAVPETSAFQLKKMNLDGEKFSNLVRANSVVCAKNETSWRCFEDLYLDHFGKRDVFAKSQVPKKLFNAKKVVMGNYFMCGLEADSNIFCWAPENTKVIIPKGLEKAKDLIARADAICALGLDDIWSCWQTNESIRPTLIDKAYGPVLSIAMNQTAELAWPWGFDESHDGICFTTPNGLGCAFTAGGSVQWFPMN